ncbi:MAG: phosphoribosylaminoimidazolesuccinocarboxamide synthase [Phycisphaeraceae bacterium]|nr:phosphoribosylaminoimidazolesuccinocarboxamide synthase [Phycisphaeraceae bacterium]
MPTIEPLFTTDLPLPARREGKVRDVYVLPADRGDVSAGPGDLASGPAGVGSADADLDRANVEALLIIATDRISAFDVVMPTPVPGKGIALTQIASFWFDLVERELGGRLGHHLLHTDSGRIGQLAPEHQRLIAGRCMISRPARVIPIECVVRGYLAGSGWKEYQAGGAVCGVALPPGLRQSDRLPEPIFTPATKAETGHDENISFERACDMVGAGIMEKMRDWSLRLYQIGHDHARARDIILADTKFEFGLDADGRLMLVDEILTPDSSRFWPAERYEPGHEQPSFDKQFVRDYLEALCARGQWDKTDPGPELPPEIVEQTLDRYREACRRLTGQEPAF